MKVREKHTLIFAKIALLHEKISTQNRTAILAFYTGVFLPLDPFFSPCCSCREWSESLFWTLQHQSLFPITHGSRRLVCGEAGLVNPLVLGRSCWWKCEAKAPFYSRNCDRGYSLR